MFLVWVAKNELDFCKYIYYNYLNKLRGESMKIIHTADLHLNSKLQTHFTQELAEKLNYKLLFAFEDLCIKASTLGVKIVLICGDLFDSEKVSPHVLERFKRII